MPSLRQFRQMSGLPDSIRRWSDAAEHVKAGQKALAEQALVSKRSLERGLARCEWCGVEIGNYGQDRNICKRCTEKTGLPAFEEKEPMANSIRA